MKLLQLVEVSDSTSVSLDKYELRLFRRRISGCLANELFVVDLCAGSVIATTSESSEVSLK